jgi:hypothetical protein
MGKVAAIAVLTLGIGATSALAYYTLVYSGALGGGSEVTATTGGTAGNATEITLGATWTPALAPGSTDVLNLNETDNNTAGPATIYLESVAESGITIDGGHPGCLPAWFTVSLSPHDVYTSGFSVARTDIAKVFSNGTSSIAFTSLPIDQSACEGATVTASFSGLALLSP